MRKSCPPTQNTIAARLAPLVLSCLLAAPALAQQPVANPSAAPYANPYLAPWLPAVPQLGAPLYIPLIGMPVPLVGQPQLQYVKPYTMRPPIPQANKRQMMQMMMPIMSNFMRMSMPDAMNWFAHKIKAKPGLKFDDVLESLMLAANKNNFKYVGSNLMWKDFQAVLGDTEAPRIEVHSFCDIAVGRDLLRTSPEFLVFLPCRIAVMEDSDKNVWVMMLDWNMDWVAGYEGSMGLSAELIRGAKDIRDKMEIIMQAAANGDL